MRMIILNKLILSTNSAYKGKLAVNQKKIELFTGR